MKAKEKVVKRPKPLNFVKGQHVRRNALKIFNAKGSIIQKTPVAAVYFPHILLPEQVVEQITGYIVKKG